MYRMYDSFDTVRIGEEARNLHVWSLVDGTRVCPSLGFLIRSKICKMMRLRLSHHFVLVL